MDALLDHTVLVYSETEDRIRRVMVRDGLTREQVISRMQAQMPEEEKRARAEFILENDGAQEHLFEQVDALYKRLLTEDAHA